MLDLMRRFVVLTYSFGNTFSNNGYATDLRILHEFHGRAVDGSRRSKIDNGVDFAVLGNGLVYGLVHGKKSLRCSPVPDTFVSCDGSLPNPSLTFC